MRRFLYLLLLAGLVLARPALALDAAALAKLALGETEEKLEAIALLVAQGDPRSIALLEALTAGELYVAGKRVLVVSGDEPVDALTGERLARIPQGAEDVMVNNRVRGAVQGALAAFRLRAPESAVRLAAARELAGGAEEAALPFIAKALEKETDPQIRALLEQTAASAQLQSGTREARIAAARTLAGASSGSVRTTLLAQLEVEQDPGVRAELERGLRDIDARMAWQQRAGLAFAGISLGSILLLAALGLAITYGLMGVINLAHGELIMIGAYATYVVQNLFQAYFPDAFDWYLLAAVPVSFCVAGLVGMALERSVIRWLYGRPLETLLATWGLSLILIQTARMLFGAQNVQVINPAFMSGGIQVSAELVLPWNRIMIIGFAMAVVAGVWFILSKTRLGLFVRSVTQNRQMASCVGVRTPRVDMWAFGIGSGVAGLAGCALSQVGNVGPELGQAYIVDSFLVVVFGGVGQLAGAVYAALILGFVNKLLESVSGAVIAKIAVLAFIIIFIQLRPQGMFALRGRAADAS